MSDHLLNVNVQVVEGRHEEKKFYPQEEQILDAEMSINNYR